MTKNTSELSFTEAQDLLIAHCSRVIKNMDEKDLELYAIQLMTESFVNNEGKVDVDSVIEEVIDYEDGELEAAAKFLAGIKMPTEFISKHCPA